MSNLIIAQLASCAPHAPLCLRWTFGLSDNSLVSVVAHTVVRAFGVAVLDVRVEVRVNRFRQPQNKTLCCAPVREMYFCLTVVTFERLD